MGRLNDRLSRRFPRLGRLDRVLGLLVGAVISGAGRDPEVRVPELALDHHQRNALASHFNGVRVTRLMWHEAPPHGGAGGDATELCAHRRLRPRPPRVWP